MYSGLCANLHGLRHFIQWKHPKVFASEHSQWDAPQLYEVGSCKGCMAAVSYFLALCINMSTSQTHVCIMTCFLLVAHHYFAFEPVWHCYC